MALEVEGLGGLGCFGRRGLGGLSPKPRSRQGDLLWAQRARDGGSVGPCECTQGLGLGVGAAARSGGPQSRRCCESRGSLTPIARKGLRVRADSILKSPWENSFGKVLPGEEQDTSRGPSVGDDVGATRSALVPEGH